MFAGERYTRTCIIGFPVKRHMNEWQRDGMKKREGMRNTDELARSCRAAECLGYVHESWLLYCAVTWSRTMDRIGVVEVHGQWARRASSLWLLAQGGSLHLGSSSQG